MDKVLWNTMLRDPRNMIGDSVVTGRDSLYRTKQVECARVGNDCVSHVTITRNIIPVYWGWQRS